MLFRSTCERARPHDEFSVARGKRLQRFSQCKACAAERWHAGDKLSRVAQKFGITKARWLELYAAQAGRCAICLASPSEVPRGYLLVDHDHACCPGERSCGRCVRGLLCARCNLALGQFRDDPELLTSAVRYLAGTGAARE